MERDDARCRGSPSPLLRHHSRVFDGEVTATSFGEQSDTSRPPDGIMRFVDEEHGPRAVTGLQREPTRRWARSVNLRDHRHARGLHEPSGRLRSGASEVVVQRCADKHPLAGCQKPLQMGLVGETRFERAAS